MEFTTDNYNILKVALDKKKKKKCLSSGKRKESPFTMIVAQPHTVEMTKQQLEEFSLGKMLDSPIFPGHCHFWLSFVRSVQSYLDGLRLNSRTEVEHELFLVKTKNFKHVVWLLYWEVNTSLLTTIVLFVIENLKKKKKFG